MLLGFAVSCLGFRVTRRAARVEDHVALSSIENPTAVQPETVAAPL